MLIGQNTTRAKQFNKKIILEIIRKYQPIPRHEIAEKTKLTRGTISNISSELIEEGLISVSGNLDEEQARAGRRSVALEINKNAIHVIGIHISMKRIQIGLVNLTGEIVSKTYVDIHEDASTSSFNDLLIATIRQFINSVGNIKISSIGVGTSGFLNINKEVILKSNNLGIIDYPIVNEVQSAFGIPVYLENNVKAMALAEKMFGAGKVNSNFMTIYLGEGIGSGIVINNSLFQGDSIGTGEFGHVTYLPDGIPCWCGNNGCIERYASETVLLQKLEIPTVNELIKKIKGNNKDAVRELEKAGEKIGITLASLLNIIHFPVVIFSGKLANEKLPLLDAVKRIVNSRSPKIVNESVQIQQSLLGEDIGLLGSASLFLSEVYN